jgi:hypothetical protein
MITLESFTIIGYFIYFIYLSLVIFPGRSFGFVYYVIMFILYVHMVMNNFEEEYKELLNNTIKASKISGVPTYRRENKEAYWHPIVNTHQYRF